MRTLKTTPAPCDGHHKMLDSGAVCDPNHSHGESVAPQWPHQ
jgi:hypothetical protein